MIQEPPALEALQARLLEKAFTDNAFHTQLLENPKATIERELGVKIAPGLEIQVIEETPTKICLVLPMRSQPGGAQEVSDQELEKVAGGAIPEPIPMPSFRSDLPGPLPRFASGFQRLGSLQARVASLPVPIP